MECTEINNTVEKIILIAGSGIISFLIVLIFTPSFAEFLRKYKLGKQIREKTMTGEKAPLFAALHAKKSGTPTMGGLLILLSILITVGLSRILSASGFIEHSLLNRKETWIPIFTLISCGIIGGIDDYMNIKGLGKLKGMSAKIKLLALIGFSAFGAYWFHYKLGINQLSIPIPGIEPIQIGWLYIPLFILVLISTANAVNFTDGLDGLAAGLMIIAFGAFGILSYVQGLMILAAFCAVVAGAIMGFLWFNVPPAKLFMGDAGAIGLGATLGVIAMLSDQVLILPIIGIIFVIEALSVIIQLTSKKFFHRKVFKIAPIHHHFEQCGWQECTIVMRFWIIGGIFTLFGTILGLINLHY